MTSESSTHLPHPSEILDHDLEGIEVLSRNNITLDSGDELAAAVLQHDNTYEIRLLTNAQGPLLLHWGTMKRRNARWQFPEPALQPEGTTAFDQLAAQSPFIEADGLQSLFWILPGDLAPQFIGFVIHGEAPDRWLKHQGKNLDLQISADYSDAYPLEGLVDAIVEGEMGPHGWTLMHRFNLCHDLINEAGNSRDAWALLFAWLRYSALRQLDWQRNYNTKPRELAHSQDRLTGRLAAAYIEQPNNRDLIRQMLACLGRGGDGQRVRDEILHIMHRHHIKEGGGTWMEQWHQKLHNNTTPDDIVICEAFLAFLEANGDQNQYDATLKAGGVTKKRLESLERPINTRPEWHPHLKDGLIHDFNQYLILLKSVHSGTDLATAINAGNHFVSHEVRESLYWIQEHFDNPHSSVLDLVKNTTWARHQIGLQLSDEARPELVKELLYLDLALEQTIRTVIERASLPDLDGDQLFELIEAAAHNLNADKPYEEINQCLHEWIRLPNEDRFSSEWALHAKAALDRLRRAVEADIDDDYQLLQSKAEWLGKEIDADKWVVTLFSEELVRGRSVFLLSMLIHHFDPVLRRQANLGDCR